MEYRTLGRSGLKVSVLTLGTMTFGGSGAFAKVGAIGLDVARRQIDLCIDAGVNLFDTADIYSDGLSEEILGQALGDKRKNVLVTTKARFPTGDGPNDRGSSRHHLIAACEASLRRLGTDYVDLYQLHEWDGLTPLEETMAAMDTLVRDGKVRYVGISNFSGWQTMKTMNVCREGGLTRPISHQIHYTLQAREAEYELLPSAVDQGLGLMIWSPLAGGLLSGKHRRGHATPEGTRQLAQWTEPPIYDTEALFDLVEVIVSVAERNSITPAQVALAWLLTRDAVSTVVVGARTEAQLTDNLKAASVTLTPEDRAELERASQKPLPYPFWHQRDTASDRLGAADLALLRPFLS
ncbi:oxidoreductase [Neoasaia chiangmaiensis NBRC 101099]|uniref:Aldo/keto reductase n=1 Tax=Neoasaia chiangmaiensis TaxID=320497 RepID=A0A1U9KRQ4_9PROT|nr:aldo/keto reductase [Neoasaia chiangmaiensis]AQS88503.1 aldo/keto reductase [Neoasaia chiangmaiensis]GBR36463.1 oxidoreductase [Neoasaia chiangmaiensis NBRC 101099]GEN15332.1 aldo/keto reductase [Neoasaia chiangmaiensis]